MRLPISLAVALLAGCSGVPPQADAGIDPPDASMGEVDAGHDAGVDAGTMDAGAEPDAGEVDAGVDAGPGDPCALGNGGCDPLTACTVVAEQATCGACPSGYSGDGSSGCVDLDECATLPDAGCSATAFCANTPGAFRCVERPTGIVPLDPEHTAAVGNTGATPHLQPCPGGQVSIGYTLRANFQSKITVADSICSELTLGGSGPAGYVLTTTPPVSPSTDDRVCPPNEVVVGMGISFSTDLRSLTVRCAPVSVRFDPNTGFSVVTGTPHDLSRFPHVSALPPDSTLTCPAGTIGAGEVASGGQYLFAFQLRCVRPAMRFEVPTISLGTTSDAPFVGVTTSTPTYRDLCPAGEVVIGLQLQEEWRSFAVECGKPLFDLPLRVAVSPGNVLPHHGLLAPRSAVRCPWNAAMTHLQMDLGSTFIFTLVSYCATFTASSATPAWTVSVDPLVPGGSVGQITGLPDAETMCPAGQVAVGVQSRMTTQSNSYLTLTHLGLVCAAPQVP